MIDTNVNTLYYVRIISYLRYYELRNIVLMNITLSQKIYVILLVLCGIFSATPVFAKNEFCLRTGNGGGTGFADSGPDISLVYEYEGRFFHTGGGIQYNSGDINLTGHFLFDWNVQTKVLQWTLSAGSLYHIGIPAKEIINQDIFLCFAPKLLILPSHTEIQIFGGVGASAMTLHGVIKKAMTFWDFNMVFGFSVSQQVGIFRFFSSLATCTYFRYDFQLVPRISTGIDISCTKSWTFGYAMIFQFSEFSRNCQNTFFTDFYIQAALKYAF